MCGPRLAPVSSDYCNHPCEYTDKRGRPGWGYMARESVATIFCVRATHVLLRQPKLSAASDWSTGTQVSQLSQSQTADSLGPCNSTYVAPTTKVVYSYCYSPKGDNVSFPLFTPPVRPQPSLSLQFPYFHISPPSRATQPITPTGSTGGPPLLLRGGNIKIFYCKNILSPRQCSDE